MRSTSGILLNAVANAPFVPRSSSSCSDEIQLERPSALLDGGDLLLAHHELLTQ
nr:hypothetical protein [Kutzneria buriramensis]WKX13526.1 hypothetical protein Q4V64_40760 [Kutzneria buriramensis]